MNRSGLVAALWLGIGSAATPADAAQPAPADSRAVLPAALLDGLEWRLVGPFRAGWGTMAVGVPGQDDTYYIGTAGGGVWKTDDSGRTWNSLFDTVRATSIGAIAIAPSNPQVIYVGSGQPEPRYDIAAGNGMYRSADGGKSWQHIGLQATRQIGAVLVDPTDADTLLVGALGHMFGANPERGVYRSSDGGKSWTQTLKIDDQTGVVDLAADPANPQIVIAAAWQARNYPWLSYFTPMTGAGSALYKSTDGGAHWSALGGEGWPKGPLGRIALGVTHIAAGTRIYAQVDSADAGGLYRSDDGGSHWIYINPDKGLGGWYTARLTVAPNDPDTLYVMDRSMKKSSDGGKTLVIVRGAPGGDDYHHLWINPKTPNRMIASTDQGTAVSVNGGATWSTWYNQPTGQVYHIATDNRFPYWIYAGQQDNGSIGIASRSDYGAISYRDWHPVGADERDDDIPDPENPNIVYGSGLGGRLSRWNALTGEVANITPWPVNSYGKRGTDVKYRYTWITPIAVAQKPPYALYQGAQVLFRSLDKGDTWQPISPDLSGKKTQGKACEGNLPSAQARDCGFGVIFAIAPSPLSSDEVWVGTDDGLVQMTRDGGKSWKNVTPKGLPAWGKVASVEVSAIEAGTAYIAVDRQREDDFAPRAYRTHDYGASWTEIVDGLPKDEFVDVLRADPVRRGLLYAGGQYGAFVSFDDGDHWQSLQRNLPTAWIRDLRVHGNDLIAGTQGRAIWVLDDVSPLRQITPAIAAADVHLFMPGEATRVRKNQNRDTPLPPEEPVGKNPPAGAVIDYWLGKDAGGELVVEIRDAEGALVRRYSSTDVAPKLSAEQYFTDRYVHPPIALSTRAGAHRLVWDLRHARPLAAEYNYSIAAIDGEDTELLPQGMLAAPGEYSVVLKIGSAEQRVPLKLRADPRLALDAQALTQAFELHRAIAVDLQRAVVAMAEQKAVNAQLAALDPRRSEASFKPALKALDAFVAAMQALSKSGGEAAPSLADIDGVLSGILTDIESSDRAPNAPQRVAAAEYRGHLDRRLARWQQIKDKDLAELNRVLASVAAGAVSVPMPKDLLFGAQDEGKDLP